MRNAEIRIVDKWELIVLEHIDLALKALRHTSLANKETILHNDSGERVQREHQGLTAKFSLNYRHFC